MRGITTAALIAMALASTGVHAGSGKANPSGTWTITRVSTDPKAPVAALVDNDPSYFGATLTFTADAIRWDTSKTNGKGTYDGCDKPSYTKATSAGRAVRCGSEAWGPNATLKSAGPRTFILQWYDGGILTLTK